MDHAQRVSTNAMTITLTLERLDPELKEQFTFSRQRLVDSFQAPSVFSSPHAQRFLYGSGRAELDA